MLGWISKRIKAHQTPWVALHILGRLVVGSPAQTLLPSSPSQTGSPSHHDHQCHQHHQHHHHIMIINIINMIIHCICIYFEQVCSGVSSLPSFPSQTGSPASLLPSHEDWSSSMIMMTMMMMVTMMTRTMMMKEMRIMMTIPLSVSPASLHSLPWRLSGDRSPCSHPMATFIPYSPNLNDRFNWYVGKGRYSYFRINAETEERAKSANIFVLIFWCQCFLRWFEAVHFNFRLFMLILAVFMLVLGVVTAFLVLIFSQPKNALNPIFTLSASLDISASLVSIGDFFLQNSSSKTLQESSQIG